MRNNAQFKTHIKQLFLAKSLGEKFSLRLELELTNDCRNNCSYCGVHHRTGISEIDFNDLTAFLRKMQAVAWEKRQQFLVTLCGGDPLLYTRFESLVSWLKDANIPFTIKANTATMSGRAIALLKETGCKGVRFTLFGDPSTHDANRGLDTHGLLTEKTRQVKVSGIPVMWNLTVGKNNLDQTLSSLPLVKAAGLDGVTIGRLARLGVLENKDNFEDMAPDHFRKFLVQVLEFYYAHYQDGFSLLFKEKLWLPLLIEEGLLEFSPGNLKKMALGCEACGKHLTVNQKGRILSCGLLPLLELGSITTDPEGIPDLLTHRPLTSETQTGCSPCAYHAACKGCRAIALANAGDLYAKDPQCWIRF
ncbi:MAG: radical SAM protein [Proteobacteria bacterium]|nr:radical SAM protein [Pseudomonadota bacterium]